jgi:hypothetical protein
MAAFGAAVRKHHQVNGLSRSDDDRLRRVSREIDTKLIVNAAEKNIHPGVAVDEYAVLVEQYISSGILFYLQREQLAFAFVNAEAVADGERLSSQTVSVDEYSVTIAIEKGDGRVVDRLLREQGDPQVL